MELSTLLRFVIKNRPIRHSSQVPTRSCPDLGDYSVSTRLYTLVRCLNSHSSIVQRSHSSACLDDQTQVERTLPLHGHRQADNGVRRVGTGEGALLAEWSAASVTVQTPRRPRVTLPTGDQPGPGREYMRVPLGNPTGLPAVFVRGFQPGPRRDAHRYSPAGSRQALYRVTQQGPSRLPCFMYFCYFTIYIHIMLVPIVFIAQNE